MDGKIKLKYINYFYISLIIIWLPLQSGILKIDGKGRTIFYFTIIVLVLNFVLDRRFSKNILQPPNIFWAIWVIFSFINSFFKGIWSESSIIYFFILNLLSPFLIMVLAAKEFKRNNNTFMRIAIITFVIFGLLDFLLFSGKGDIVESTGREGSMLGNSAPLNMIFLFFLVCLLIVKKQIKLYLAILLSVFSISSTFISSTRKALGAIMIMFLFLIISQIRFTPKRITIFIISAFSLFLSINFIINNTEVGKRIIDTQDQASGYYLPNNKLLTFLGDRAIQYVWAWELFNKHPITGIGLTNFIKQSKSEYVLHSEYMVQLCECGIIGTLFFWLFLIWFWKSLFINWNRYSSERNKIWVLSGGMLAIMFIQLTSWTYSEPQYFLVYGIIIGHLTNIKNESWNTHRHG